MLCSGNAGLTMCHLRAALDGVPGWLYHVLPSRGRGPADLPAGELLGVPAGILFEPVVEAALRIPVAQAGPAARLVGNVVLEGGVHGGAAAAGPGARGVPDLGQVPEHDPGVVASCLVAVITVAGGDRP